MATFHILCQGSLSRNQRSSQPRNQGSQSNQSHHRLEAELSNVSHEAFDPVSERIQRIVQGSLSIKEQQQHHSQIGEDSTKNGVEEQPSQKRDQANASHDPTFLQRIETFDSAREVLPIQEVSLGGKEYDVRVTGLVGPVYFAPHKGMRLLPAQYREQFFHHASPVSRQITKKDDMPIPLVFREEEVPPFDKSNTVHVGSVNVDGKDPVEWVAVNPQTGLPSNLLRFNSCEKMLPETSSLKPQRSTCPVWSTCWPAGQSICCATPSIWCPTVNHGTELDTSNNNSYKRVESVGPPKIQYITQGPLVVTAHLPIPTPQQNNWTVNYSCEDQKTVNDFRTYPIWFPQKNEEKGKNAASISAARRKGVKITAPSPFASSQDSKRKTSRYR